MTELPRRPGQPRPETGNPEDSPGSFMPAAPLPQPYRYEEPGTWVGAIAHDANISWWMDGASWMNRELYGKEPGFNPFDNPDDLKGYEPYYDSFVTVGSHAEMNALKQRIDSSNESRDYVEQNGNLASALLAGLVDPVNLIPIGGAGLGVVKGALIGAGVTAGLTVGTNLLKGQIDPTAKDDDPMNGVALSALLGGLLGGVAGHVGRAAPELSRGFLREMNAIDARLVDHVPRTAAETVASHLDPIHNEHTAPAVGDNHAGTATPPEGAGSVTGGYRESGEVGARGSGIAPAYGVEKVVGLMSPLGRLAQSGIAKVSTLAQKLGGELSFLTKENLDGIPAPVSAFLQSKRWVAMAAQVSQDLERFWLEGLNGSPGVSLGGLNITAKAEKTRQFLGQAGDRLSFKDFKDALFFAHGEDGLRVPDTVNGKAIDPRMKAALDKALPQLRTFYDVASAEGVKAGFIPTKEYMRRQASLWRDKHERMGKRWDELRAKSLTPEGLTPNEVNELERVGKYRMELEKRVSTEMFKSLATDEELAQRIDDIYTRAEERKGRMGDIVQQMQSDLVARFEALSEVYRTLGGRKDAGLPLTPAQERFLVDAEKALAQEAPAPVRNFVQQFFGADGKMAANENLTPKSFNVDPVTEGRDWANEQIAAGKFDASDLQVDPDTGNVFVHSTGELLHNPTANAIDAQMMGWEIDYQGQTVHDAILNDPKWNPPANDTSVVQDTWYGRDTQVVHDEPRWDDPAVLKTMDQHIEDLASWAESQGIVLRDAAGNEIDPPKAADLAAKLNGVVTPVEGFGMMHSNISALVSEHLVEGLNWRPGEEHLKDLARRYLNQVGLTGDRVFDWGNLSVPERDRVTDMVHNSGAADMAERLYKEAEGLADSLKSGFRVNRLPHYETGKPTVVDAFHGTAQPWVENGWFDPAKLGTNTNMPSARQGFFAARNPETASAYLSGDAGGGVEFAPIWGSFDPDKDIDWDAQVVRLHNDFGSNYTQFEYYNAVQDAKMAMRDVKQHFDAGLYDEGLQTWDQWEASTDLPSAVLQTLAGEMGLFNSKVSAPNIIPTRIRMENPFIHNDHGSWYHERKYGDIQREAIAKGHDGVIILNSRDGGDVDVIYSWFDPDKAKPLFQELSPHGGQGARVSQTVATELPPGMAAPANDARPGLAPPRPELLHVPDAGNSDSAFLTPKQHALLADAKEAAAGPLLTEAQRTYVESLLQKIMGDIDYKGPEAHYLPRKWDVAKVMEDPKRLQGIYTQWFSEHPEEIIGNATPERAAQRMVDSIMALGDDDIPNPGAPGKLAASFQRERAAKIPNARVADFVNTDVDELTRDYAHKAGTGIEYARQFNGDTQAGDAIHEALIEAARTLGGSTEKIRATLSDIEDDLTRLRDSAQGRLRVGNPMTLTQATVRVLSNTTALATMGRVSLSAINEIARPIMVFGFRRTFGFMMNGLLGEIDSFKAISKEFRGLTGEAMDVSHADAMQRFMESGGWTGRQGSSAAMALDKATAGYNRFAEGGFYILNGLAHITDYLKTWTQVMSAHFLVDDLRMLAAGQGDAKFVGRMAGMGFDQKLAQQVIAQPIERGRYLNLPNVGAWGPEAEEIRSRFVQAVAGEVRRVINTPGPADKSLLQQGFTGARGKYREWALVRFPMQFMSWGLAANQKVLLSALQGRDANALAGAASLVAMGYLTTYLKASPTSWDKMEEGEKWSRAIESSGVLASLSDLNSVIENGTRNVYGVRPMLGLPPRLGPGTEDQGGGMTTAFGAFGDKAVDLYDAFTNPYKTRREKYGSIRRALPLNNLIWTKKLFDAGQQAATDYGP